MYHLRARVQVLFQTAGQAAVDFDRSQRSAQGAQMIGEGPSARPDLDDGTSGRFNAVNDRCLDSFIVQKILAVFVTATFISWQEIAPRIRRRSRACRKAPPGRTGRTAELIN